MLNREAPFKGIIKSLGLVFGDIGTSPIYTIPVVFLLIKPTGANVISLLITFADITYLLSNSYKIPHGGYWSLIIGAIPFSVIML
jgi:KUP system potassium uptake protein